jgi:hypothetical protein
MFFLTIIPYGVHYFCNTSNIKNVFDVLLKIVLKMYIKFCGTIWVVFYSWLSYKYISCKYELYLYYNVFVYFFLWFFYNNTICYYTLLKIIVFLKINDNIITYQINWLIKQLYAIQSFFYIS